MERTFGFRLFDELKYRERLDVELRRVGYSLGGFQTDEPLICELDIAIEPLGNSPRLCLRLTQDTHQDWAFGTLFFIDNPSEELADLEFNSRKQYVNSCYDAWLDSIVRAVRVTSQKKSNREST